MAKLNFQKPSLQCHMILQESLGEFDLKRRYAEWSVYDIKIINCNFI